ncbi:MAG: RNA polymerase-binding protein DksA [Alphaproteobacteria bacterium GM202ARS2]|nr:RNA polymerase-binding protein DksA [Alphaproteobacteria bacterium GM202ARS2]
MTDTTIKLPQGYKPSEDEAFMNPQQREYFRQKLLRWKKHINNGINKTLEHIQDDSQPSADILDLASIEEEHDIDIASEERALKLIDKIDQAIQRIDKNEYGYCQDTGKPISLSRLEARPIATLCIEAQEKHEQQKRSYSNAKD